MLKGIHVWAQSARVPPPPPIPLATNAYVSHMIIYYKHKDIGILWCSCWYSDFSAIFIDISCSPDNWTFYPIAFKYGTQVCKLIGVRG